MCAVPPALLQGCCRCTWAYRRLAPCHVCRRLLTWLFSARERTQGLRSLERSLTELDSRQLRALREALLAWQEGHGPLPEGGWPARLVAQVGSIWEAAASC